ncbi:MAG: hypothetical protein PHT69_10490 [Bacteroidales bacterium]|nr:hypothetical protein [Bacteroidales bacterium]
MVKTNKFEKSFGPVGSSAGQFILIFGIIICFFSLSGVILILIGGFVGFTSTSTKIDFDRKMFKFSNNLFGFIPIGKWIPIDLKMKLGIKKSNKVWRTYSRSNRSIDIDSTDFYVYLLDANHKEIIPLIKKNNLDSAKHEIDFLSEKLGLKIV